MVTRLRLHHANLATLALGVLALGACSKTGSPPGGFGVNVTVDATKVKASDLGTIDTVHLKVTSDKTGAPEVMRTLADAPAALKSGSARFHYTPASTVLPTETLTFVLGALHGTNLVATGSGSVKLAAGAVSLTITLSSAGGDGGTDGGNTDVGAGEVVNPDGKENGTACASDDQCGTGFCTDGVCCNERCADVCASCALGGSKGTCTAYPADTDPELQCQAVVPMAPDAGASTDASDEAGASEAGATEAGAGEAGATDAGVTDADQSDAVVINPPDGGFMTMPKACGGTCNGARACKFPTATTSCGKAFCNTASQAASFVCDGHGACTPALSDCQDYACAATSGTCGTQCTSTADCLPADFCDGTKKCTTKKGNGVACVTPDECSSGNCIAGPTGGVCCNTACDSPLTCTMAGAVGQCKCAECPNGTCQVFYPDVDGDGKGDRTATYAAHTAKAACAGTPPAGYVADNTDCDDADSNVHPGQTAFFPTKSRNGAGTFDYDCDGMLQTQTPMYVGGSCKFCGAVGSCSLVSATCSTANQPSSFQCPQEFYNPIIRQLSETLPDQPITTPIGAPGGATSRVASVTPTPIVPVPGRFECCGCLTNDRAGYLTNVACGATANVYTCSPCAAAGQGPATATVASRTQACH